MKPAFFRVDNLVVNRYEVREVQLGKLINGTPVATITYKDASKVVVKGCTVPYFVSWILDKEPKYGYCANKDYDTFCYQDDQF